MIQFKTGLGADQAAANEGAMARLGAQLQSDEQLRLEKRRQSFQEGATAASHNLRAQGMAKSFEEAEKQRAFEERQRILGFQLGEKARETQHGRNLEFADHQADRADQRDATQYERQKETEKRQYGYGQMAAREQHRRGMEKQDAYLGGLQEQDEARHQRALQLGRQSTLRALGQAVIDGVADIRIAQGKAAADKIKDDRDMQFKLLNLIVNQGGVSGHPRISVAGHKMMAIYHQNMLDSLGTTIGRRMASPSSLRSYVENATGETYEGAPEELADFAMQVARNKLAEHSMSMNYVMDQEDQQVGALADLMRAIGGGDELFSEIADSLTPMQPAQEGADWMQPHGGGQTYEDSIRFGGDPFGGGQTFPSLRQLSPVPGSGGRVLRTWDSR